MWLLENTKNSSQRKNWDRTPPNSPSSIYVHKPSLAIFFKCSVQSLSCVRLFVTPWTAAHQASLSISNSLSLLKLMSIESVMPFNHLILCRPLLLLPSVFPSIRVFFNESVLPIRWPTYWSFSFSISPSNEYSGQISFRTDWFDLFAVQEKAWSPGERGVLEKGKSWRRERLPTPVFWPGEFHGVYSPWGRKELDTTEWLSLLNCRPVLFKLWLFFPNPLQWVLL